MTQIRPFVFLTDPALLTHPLNRPDCPFVFQPFIADDSLFQDTLERVSVGDCLAPIILTPSFYHDQIVEQCEDIAFEYEDIWVCDDLDPIERAVNWSLEHEPDVACLLCPLPHFIADQIAFERALGDAVSAAQNGYLVQFGVVADYPVADGDYIGVGDRLNTGFSGHHIDHFYVSVPADQAQDVLDLGRTVQATGIVCGLPQVLSHWHRQGVAPERHAVVSILSAWADLNRWPGLWKAISLLLDE